METCRDKHEGRNAEKTLNLCLGFLRCIGENERRTVHTLSQIIGPQHMQGEGHARHVCENSLKRVKRGTNLECMADPCRQLPHPATVQDFHLFDFCERLLHV
eukprot:758941-Hanusia_phi.AAC.8